MTDVISPQQPNRLLRVSECADRLGLSVRSLWNLIADGKLPAVRISRRATRVLESDLEKFILQLKDQARR